MRRLSFLCLVLCLVAPAARAGESTLFLADSTFDGELTRIFSVDPATGTMTLHADLGRDVTPVLALAAADAETLYLVGSDLTAEARCGDARSCLLLRVVLDPALSTPVSVTPIGPVTAAGETVVEIVGLSFDRRGRLWASSQQGGGLYVVDPETANATLVGTMSVEVHGGDVTFDDDDRLWLWTNLGQETGRYEIDPVNAAATPNELHPDLNFAGMAALGHGSMLYGAGPLDDRLHQIDASSGLTGSSVPLVFEGNAFDHKRGDLDSPRCESDAACADGDACTLDACSPGGCVHETSLYADADGDRRENCSDLCPETTARQRVDADGCSIADRCPCDGPGRAWHNHGEYVSCVAAAASEILGPGRERGRAVSSAARSECGGSFKQAGATTRAPRRAAP